MGIDELQTSWRFNTEWRMDKTRNERKSSLQTSSPPLARRFSGTVTSAGLPDMERKGSLKLLPSRPSLKAGSQNPDRNCTALGHNRLNKPSLTVEEAIKQNNKEHYRRLLEMFKEKYSNSQPLPFNQTKPQALLTSKREHKRTFLDKAFESAPTRTGYSDVSSELGARSREELEQTERHDAQFVNYLRCRGMNPATNTDSAAGSMSYSDDLLSPELQALWNRGRCRFLTLSQRPATSSSQAFVSDLGSLSLNHAEACSSFLDHRGDSSNVAPMTWQQEKRALQETVIALRELLAQRRTDNDSRVDGESDESQKQLECSHEMQQEQRSKIQSLRSTIEEEQEALKSAQTTVEHLEQLLEQERVLNHRREREVGHLREAKHESCEQQRSEVMTLKGQVEQGNVAFSSLRRELQMEQSRRVWLEKRLAETRTQMQKCNQAFESERERSGLLKVEVKELEKKIQLMKGKEKEWDDKWEKERRRCRQEEIDGEKRQERMNNKLLEMLRQQEQQRMQELKENLEALGELDKAVRMFEQTSSTSRPFNDLQGGGSLQHSKMSPASSRSLLDTLMKENSELSENLRSLSQRKSYKRKLSCTKPRGLRGKKKK